MRAKFGVLLAAVLAVSCLAWAMPPYQGIQEPEALKAMRLKGMDSPERGIILQLRETKGSDAKITGSRKYPVVMGYFTDLAATNTQSEFQTMLFSNASGAKSVNNYYRDMSYNAMSCSGKVDDWRSSNNTVAYYSVNYGLNSGTTANTYEFIRNVLAHADSFVSFADSSYDMNHDGYVDVLWVIHAGKGAEEGASNIWSHSFYLSGFGGGATYYTTNDISPFTGNPVRINEYIINPERTNYADGNNSTTEMIGCGVFCHEFGHALGLPDLYDTDDSGPGIGRWSVMAGGSWGGNGNTGARPVALDVWCRRFLGWADPTKVANDGEYTVNSIMATDASSSYKLGKLGADTVKQFWLVENRFKNAPGPVSSVRWDSLLYGQGLLIYHIDSTYTTTTYLNANTVNASNTRPYGVAIEETDMTTAGYSSELYNGANNGDAADAWNSGTQAIFDSIGTSYPVSYYNGANSTTGGPHSLVAIRAIPAASTAMTCSMFVGVAPAGVAGRPEGVPASFALQSAWPNPARGQVNFSYQLPQAARVEIMVYNVLGQEVKRFLPGVQGAGQHSAKWNDDQISEGVYFVRIQAGEHQATRKFIVVK